jgi:hypothetical protein
MMRVGFDCFKNFPTIDIPKEKHEDPFARAFLHVEVNVLNILQGRVNPVIVVSGTFMSGLRRRLPHATLKYSRTSSSSITFRVQPPSRRTKLIARYHPALWGTFSVSTACPKLGLFDIGQVFAGYR